jgi:hypothetical protein
MMAHPPTASVVRSLQTLVQQIQRRAVAVAVGTGLLTSLFALAGQAPLQASLPLADGQYLYGEAQSANVPGSTYMLLQVQESRVVGAFYQPSSSYDCFHGTLTSRELDLAIVDSYEGDEYPYQVALIPDQAPIASAAGGLPARIDGFHQLAGLSSADQAILNTCLSEHPL